MKKKSLLPVVLLCASLSCACGNSQKTAETQAATETVIESESTAETEGRGISVDEGLLNVEVTIPASMFEDTSEEDIKASAEENGFSGCTINDDGSVTYKMSKAKHKEWLSELKESIDQSINDIINGDNAVESFQKIEYSDDLTNFDIYVDADKFGGFDSMYALTFYISGAYYQAFAGIDADNIDVKVNFINNATNETISSSTYRDMVESWNETDESETESQEG